MKGTVHPDPIEPGGLCRIHKLSIRTDLDAVLALMIQRPIAHHQYRR